METDHKFLAVLDRHSDVKGTVTYRVACSCGEKVGLPDGKPADTREAALAAFDRHAELEAAI